MLWLYFHMNIYIYSSLGNKHLFPCFNSLNGVKKSANMKRSKVSVGPIHNSAGHRQSPKVKYFHTRMLKKAI